MKTPFSLKLLLSIVAAAALASGAAAFRLSKAVDSLETRASANKRAIDDLAAAVLGHEEREAAQRPGAAAAGAQAGDLDAVMLKLQALGRRVEALEAGDIDELGIQEVIDNRLSQKMASAMGRRPGRITLDAMAGDLGMSEAQKKRAAEIVNRSKADVASLLNSQGADGRSMSERIADIAKGPGSRGEKDRRAFELMSATTVPGRDESYVSAIVGIREDAIAEFKSNLTEEQLSRLQNTRIKLFGIDTGFSPVAAGMEDAMGGGSR